MAEPFSSTQGMGREAAYSSGSFESQQGSQQDNLTMVDHIQQFVKENPSTAAMWCFGIGFVLGWRLKPW